MKNFYKTQVSLLSEDAKEAKSLVEQMCSALSSDKIKLTVLAEKYNDHYECHILATGDCSGTEDEEQYICTKPTLLFWGGHYDVKRYYDALSKAWVSILEDAIGIGELGNLFSLHEYSKFYKYINDIDFTSKSIEELKLKLKAI